MDNGTFGAVFVFPFQNSELKKRQDKKMSNQAGKDRSCLSCVATYTALFVIFATGILYYHDLTQSTSQPKLDILRFIRTNTAAARDYPEKLILNTSIGNTSSESFSSAMTKIPWAHFKSSLSSKEGFEKAVEYVEALSFKLIDFNKRPPPLPLNKSCDPPELELSSGFTCTRLTNPRKVGVILLFGFEVDVLEIHFHELDAVVDKFFIVESTISHSPILGVAKKPLLWDQLRHDERFSKFRSKVVHFVMDEGITSTRDIASAKKMWRVEQLQDEFSWRKFMEWNSKTNYFNSDDLLGFGHADEIPHRDNIFTLKHCRLPLATQPVDIGIWFPSPYIDTAYRTDWPVNNHPYTLGDPTFWTVAKAYRHFYKTGKVPSRGMGHSPTYLLGGIHLSSYSYPPFLMLKRMSATESSKGDIELVIQVGMMYAEGKMQEANERLLKYCYLGPGTIFSSRTIKISDLAKRNKAEVEAIVKVPWFIKCNPGRYPSLSENGSDPRLGDNENS